MLFGFNFQLLVALFLIPLLYASIIFFTSPYKSVTFKRGLLYLWGGMFSTVIVQLFYFFIPHLTDTHTKFYEYFAVVGPVEEISKFILFYGIISLTKDRKTSEHPFKYMFYFAMTGLGFAILENIHYIIRYGELILLTRTFTSTIAHMIFGLFFGYCIGLGTITRRNFEDRSVFGVLVRKNSRLKMFIYILIGLIFSSFYHGMYNYNLATSDESSKIILIMLLTFGLLMSKFLSDDLNRRWSLRSK